MIGTMSELIMDPKKWIVKCVQYTMCKGHEKSVDLLRHDPWKYEDSHAQAWRYLESFWISRSSSSRSVHSRI